MDVNALNQGESVGIAYSAFSSAGRSRQLGGTTQLWYGQCVPMDAIDFEPRPWVPYSGWPFPKPVLDPYYGRAEDFFDIRGATYDTQIWAQFGLQPPPLEAAKLHYKPTVWCPKTHMGKVYKGQLAKSTNIAVLIHANVVKINSAANHSRVDSVSMRALSGVTGRVAAKHYILCCGGIENARLLLLSEGLGNGYDTVGRCFQEHIHACCARIATHHPKPLQDTLAMLYPRRGRYLPKMVLSEAVQRRQHTLNCTANLVFQFEGRSAAAASRNIYLALKQRRRPQQVGKELKIILSHGSDLLSLLYRRYVLGRSSSAPPSAIWLQPHVEQAPNWDSRIRLSSQRDALGLPLAQIDWRLSELERHTAETMVQTLQSVWADGQPAQVQPVEWLRDSARDWRSGFSSSSHPMGTTRMADNPRQGVVDRNGQVHGVANLFIAGSSVFPTSGYANPTLTLVALAIRLGDYLKTI
ncbi:MAG: GMC oxidoreductase [Nodosilinea sp.]